MSIAQKEDNVMRVAIIGNPNSGKSTLFNAMTGLRQKTGNYPGVTVEKKSGRKKILNQQSKSTYDLKITDLPGTYSLFPKSDDEKISFDEITNLYKPDFPDILLIVVDASNLKRNLLLASQVIDLNLPVVIALNMIDVAEEMGYNIDATQLEKILGVPVTAINSRKSKGISDLEQKLFEARPSVFFSSEKYLSLVSSLPERQTSSTSNYHKIIRHINSNEMGLLSKELARFEYNDNLERFKKINSIWDACVSRSKINTPKNFNTRLDDFLLHRFFGPLFFLFVLFIIFQSVFYLAELPMALIESGFSVCAAWLKELLPTGKMSGLITDGIISGISGIVVFVPQIALLFGFLALLEDSGYMARVSVIMDKLMRVIGLNGRSVIPLISGVACAVPAIMGTRTIPNWKERLITIMVTPLISCSARLPVFTLLISLMVPESQSVGFFNTRGLWMFGLYLSGFFAAIVVALLMKFLVKAKSKSYFIIELPIYRAPQIKTVFLAMLSKIKVFLWDAGKVIMIISIALWFLKSYGPSKSFVEHEKSYYQNELRLKNKNLSLTESTEIKVENKILSSRLLESSYAGHIGRFIEPAIRPLGFDWKIGIALITSFAAREVFVGTMATIYSSEEDETTLRNKIAEQKDTKTGRKIYTNATCISLLLFYVFAMQCMSTMAVVKRETGSWKWPIIQFIYMGAMAWIASFTAYYLLGML